MKSAFIALAAFALVAIPAGSAFSAEPAGSGDLKIRPIAKVVAGLYGQGIDNDVVRDGSDDVERDYQDTAIKSDGEIGILGSLALDSGLRISSKVTWNLDQELQEYSMSFNGNAGAVYLGGGDTAAMRLHRTFKSFTPGGDNASIDGGDFYFLPRLSTAPDGNEVSGRSTYIEIGEDRNMITYLAPRLGGLKFGISYVPAAEDVGQENQSRPLQSDAEGSRIEDIIVVAANYSRSFWRTPVVVSISYLAGSGVGSEPDAEILSLGARLEWNAFTFGGGYSDGEGLEGSENAVDDFGRYGIDAGVDSDYENNSFSLGMTYETGPWIVGVAWRSSEKSFTRTVSGTATQEEVTNEAYQFGFSYDMGGGLDVGMDVRFAEDSSSSNVLTEELDGLFGGFVLGYQF